MLKNRSFASLFVAAALAVCSMGSALASPPSQPLSLGISNQGCTDGKPTFTWSAPASGGSPTSYGVLVSSYPGGEQLSGNESGGGTTGSPPATSVKSPTSFTENIDWYAEVFAGNADGTSPPSNEYHLLVIPAPSQVLNVTGNAGPNGIGLSWDATFSAEFYVVSESTTSGAETALARHPTDPSFVIPASSLTSGTTYYFKIAAWNECGPGPKSAEFSITAY